MKRAFKIIGITLLIIVALLAAIPIVLQSKIDAIALNYAEKNLNAKVAFDNMSLSLLRSFPKANLKVENLIITNHKPFEGETLATAKSISFEMPLKEIFKSQGDGALMVNEIELDEALLTIKTNKFGDKNYDILVEKENDTTASGFTFDVEDYSITNSAFTYLDEKSQNTVYVTNINHTGKGTFSADVSELDTFTEAQLSLSIDSTEYLSNQHIKLEALFDVDLQNDKYTFKENHGYINQLPLAFQGYIQLVEKGQEIDISFTNPTSSFKDFLAVFPERYSKNLDGVETTGDFKVNGLIKGLSSEETIPNLDIRISSNNASFKYPNLPKRVENININAAIKNDNGKTDDTYVNIDNLDFKIDNDVFKSSATLKNLTANMLIDANIEGVLNLANLSRAYPVDLKDDISGILRGNLETSFDMDAIETNAYHRIKNSGQIKVNDIKYTSEDLLHPVFISSANLAFQPGTVSLQSFIAETGGSDISATGTIKNLLGFVLSKQKLQGNFHLNSNTFVVSDFIVKSEPSSSKTKSTSTKESIKIPDFLDCTIQANAGTVVYDNLDLKDVNGTLIIKDQKASINGLTSSIFDGILAVTGHVSTASSRPSFNLNIGADGFDIGQSFRDLELFQGLAPIAKALDGTINTTINLKGFLNKNFTPEFSTLTGDALAEVLTTHVNPLRDGVLEKLEGALGFIDFEKLDLKDIKTKLDFQDGFINIKPFNIKYDDIIITISGSHGFDKSMNHQVVFQVPAKYLGSEVNRLIGKIDDAEVNSITIPITADITGTYNSPKVSTDLSSSVSNLTKQLVEIEKQKLLNTGKDKIKDMLGGILSKDEKPNKETKKTTKDSTITIVDSTIVNTTKTDSLKKDIKNVLGQLIKNRKKKNDSTN